MIPNAAAGDLKIRQFPNGLTLLGEPMPWLRTAACTVLVPAGTAHEPPGKEGLATAVTEMLERGCGALDSRAYLEAFDELGISTSSSVMTTHSDFSAAMRKEHLPRALELLSCALQEPHLPEGQLEEVRQLCLQELQALDDDPSNRCFTDLKRFRFRPPYGRVAQGTREGIGSIQHADVLQFYERCYVPDKTVLAVAGNFDWDDLCRRVERLFGKWEGKAATALPPVEIVYGERHIDYASSQTHLALAYDCPWYGHPEYFQGRAVVGILSDGMSSRLFTEVREKRGLVYAVFATCLSIRQSGNVLCYAGTTSTHAQETIQVVLQTIDSIASGISEDELRREKCRLKSSLIFEQESSLARSQQIASDWYVLGRVPSREEIRRRVDELTCDVLLDHFNRWRPRKFTLVTVGPEPVELPDGVDHS